MTSNAMTGRNLGVRRTTGASGTDLGLLVLRVGFGGLMLIHGSQKLFGWFNGAGWSATTAGFEKLGYRPGKVFGTLAGLCEFTGGALLLLGLLVPLGAAITIGTMINAMNVTWHHGLEGYEGALLFAVAAAVLAFTGPGAISVDHGRPWERHGAIWGIAAIVLGVVAAVVTLAFK